MRKDTFTVGNGWLIQWTGDGATASVSKHEGRLLLSLASQPDVTIPRKYWRWLAGILVETADKMDAEEL